MAWCLGVLVVMFPVGLLARSEKQNPAAPSSASALALQAPLDINAATEEQLQALPGIGPAMARRIVHYRERNGPFRRPEELLIIRGMSKKKLARIRPYIKAHS